VMNETALLIETYERWRRPKQKRSCMGMLESGWM
jgi:hypothetical protein